MSSSNANKPCARCGVDCTDRPRVKDEKGRYFCRECYDRALNQMASLIVETAPAVPIAPKQTAAPATPGDLDGPADLLGVVDSHDGHTEGHDNSAAVEAATGAYELATPDRQANIPMKECPSCFREMRAREAVCPHCGFNTILNREADEALPTVTADFKDGKVHCGKCAYPIEGLGSLVCPECGSPNRVPNRRHWDAEDSAAIRRTQIIRPGVYVGIGLAGFGVLALLNHSATDFLMYLVLYLLGLPAVIGAFLLCSVIWLGFNDKLVFVVWKLAGIMALTSLAIFWIFWLMGTVFYVPLAVSGLIFASLIRIELDVDQGDAWLVALAALVAQFGSYFALVAIARSLGWIV